MFVFNGAVHMLLFTAFGELAMSALHEWTGSSFKPVNLKVFNPSSCKDRGEINEF